MCLHLGDVPAAGWSAFTGHDHGNVRARDDGLGIVEVRADRLRHANHGHDAVPESVRLDP